MWAGVLSVLHVWLQPATAQAQQPPSGGVDLTAIPEEYRPNHHIFYANRVGQACMASMTRLEAMARIASSM